jgi:glucose-1-phosphate cytidylyltransferase
MKVVLFCGGLGTRLREHSDTIAKPLVPIGPRPIIWHLMRYYAHFGHHEFILCLGYGGEMIREYFLNYSECESNDFTLSEGGRRIEPHRRDIEDWRITFVDTGLHANVGERLVAVREFVEDDDVFLANYSDGLSDLDLDAHVDSIVQAGAVAGFAAVRPQHSLHCVSVDDGERVVEIVPMDRSEIRVNGGFFAFRKEIFDHIEAGEELVEAPFRRLIDKRRLVAKHHDGFWAAMDTFKDKIRFDRMYARRERPWELWNRRSAGS